MRRFLAMIGVLCALAGFVLIPLSIFYNINFLIPVGLIVAAFLILLYVKQLPSDLDEENSGSVDTADDAKGDDGNEQ